MVWRPDIRPNQYSMQPYLCGPLACTNINPYFSGAGEGTRESIQVSGSAIIGNHGYNQSVEKLVFTRCESTKQSSNTILPLNCAFLQ